MMWLFAPSRPDAIYAACESGDADALKAALDAAAPHADELTRAIADKNGVTPLWRAARFGRVKCVVLLLDRHPEWRDVPNIDKQQAGGRRGDISEQLQFVLNSSPILSSARA